MSVMSKILGFLGFESLEKESKQKNKREKPSKARYNLKKKQKSEKVDNIDGVKVVYPQDFDDVEKFLDYLKKDEAVIISIEYTEKDDIEKVFAFFFGASEMVGGKFKLLEKDKYYIFLPEGVDIEE